MLANTPVRGRSRSVQQNSVGEFERTASKRVCGMIQEPLAQRFQTSLISQIRENFDLNCMIWTASRSKAPDALSWYHSQNK